MRIKKGEKWYGGIVFSIMLGLIVGISLRERGIVFKDKDGAEKEISKLYSILWVLTSIIPLAGFCLKFWFLKTNDFICKYCRKEGAGGFETKKGVCKECYEKRKR